MNGRIERAIQELADAMAESDLECIHIAVTRDLAEIGTVSTFKDPAVVLAILRRCVERVESGEYARNRQLAPKPPDESSVSREPEKP